MIKVQLNSLLNGIQVFQEISNTALPVRAAYNVARLIREIEKENQLFDESRRKILDKYGEKDENGELKIEENGNIHILPDKIADCNRELNDLLTTEIEINAEKIKIDDIEDVKLTPAQLTLVDAFFE